MLVCPCMFRHYSQFSEDALVDGLLHKIGTTNKMLCDVGAHDGTYCSNTRFFMGQLGWDGVFIEPDPKSYKILTQLYPRHKCLQEAISTENTIDGLLQRQNFPKKFDLLSIDIDGQDCFVWADMVKYRARVVVIEWSPYVTPGFIPIRNTDGKEGVNQAGLYPMLHLAWQKKYKVMAITPVNLICVEGELLKDWKMYWDGKFPLPFVL